MKESFTTQKLILGLRSEVEHEGVGRFPLTAFPRLVQEIILNKVAFQGYRVEYFATALLSAAATAIGNSCKLRVEGNWLIPPSLYFILVGRPGLGKSHPIETAFRPVRNIDKELYDRYVQEYKAYQAAKEKGEAVALPIQHQLLISDATPEAVKRALSRNPNGVCDIYDEIYGWLMSATRTNSSLIEDLLSIFNCTPVSVLRVTNPEPIYIASPCLNIIGSTQTTKISDLISKGYLDNGLLDRFQFAYPENQKANYVMELEPWQLERIERDERTWEQIVYRIYELVNLDGNNVPVTKFLTLSKEARAVYTQWWNHGVVDAYNQIEDERLIKSRTMKRNNNTYRMALVLQALRYACGEAGLTEVDVDSVRGAIALNECYEESYDKIMAANSSSRMNSQELAVFDSLPGRFETETALTVCKGAGIERRASFDYLNRLQRWGLVRKLKKGLYEKIHV